MYMQYLLQAIETKNIKKKCVSLPQSHHVFYLFFHKIKIIEIQIYVYRFSL